MLPPHGWDVKCSKHKVAATVYALDTATQAQPRADGVDVLVIDHVKRPSAN